MIEMLGVLAIIGVLSAGGIMGYTTAMENYRINKFADDLEIFIQGVNNLYSKPVGTPIVGAVADGKYMSLGALYKMGILPKSLYNDEQYVTASFVPSKKVWCRLGENVYISATSIKINRMKPNLHLDMNMTLPKSTCVRLLKKGGG